MQGEERIRLAPLFEKNDHLDVSTQVISGFRP
jgi:hypothetical protein